MADIPASLPIPNVAPLGRDGRFTEVWIRFFLALFNRSGGSGGVTPGQITIEDVLAVQDFEITPQFDQSAQIFGAEGIFATPSVENVLDMVFAPAANTDSTQAAHTVTLGASPATYTATSKQAFHVSGGAVSALSVARGPLSMPIGSSGADIVDQTYVSGVGFTPGVTTSLTLPSSFGAVARLWVFFDGTYQGDNQIASLVGTTLTFTSAIPVGVTDVFIKGLSITAQGVGSQLIELSPGDQVTVTYSSLPTVTILPR